MKLKVLDIEKTPEWCAKRVVLKHDDGYNDWVRDSWDHTFILWTGDPRHYGDRYFDRKLNKRVQYDPPFEPVLDEDGYETGDIREKDGLIVIPIDVFEHSGRVWFIRGEAPAGCHCQFDSTCYHENAPYYLYVDKERWDKYCGNCPWEFVDGKPTDQLKKAAYDVARSEIHEMNLREENAYYGYEVEEKITETSDVEITNQHDHSVKTEHREDTIWESVDSCYGYLTGSPAEDVDFKLGVPVVTPNDYLVGDTFEQECFALSDDMTGKFVKFTKDSYELVEDPAFASLFCKQFLNSNRKAYENDLKKALTVVDVTERVWARYPECHA